MKLFIVTFTLTLFSSDQCLANLLQDFSKFLVKNAKQNWVDNVVYEIQTKEEKVDAFLRVRQIPKNTLHYLVQ